MSENQVFQIDTATGLLTKAKYCLSPNYDARPDVDDIQGIVIHCISLPPEEFGEHYIEDLFLNQLDCSRHPYFQQLEGLKVSSHLLIRRDGEVIQFVPFHERAWHAGVSTWMGRDHCNDFTIGIELEGSDSQPYETVQYEMLADVVVALCASYPKIDVSRITGHEHIAPGRKTDPGPFFDWQRLRQLLK
jgi:AmpD protein